MEYHMENICTYTGKYMNAYTGKYMDNIIWMEYIIIYTYIGKFIGIFNKLLDIWNIIW
jgi:hypothetical protein